MGEVSKRLHRRLTGGQPGRPKSAGFIHTAEGRSGEVATVDTLIRDGHDPAHAAYTYLQQVTACFAENASQMPELKSWAGAVSTAEDEYLPSGPPMSPLTGSFFWTWALYDLPIARTRETVATCQLELNDLFGFNADQVRAMKNLAASRMGIYEHVGTSGQFVKLQELTTNEERLCHSTTGYLGRPGELWYLRLLPPVAPELPYHVAFTTPYVLRSSKADWLSYLKRTLASAGPRASLARLLKHGPNPTYWLEYVFVAYCGHQSDAVFLTGIPDLKATLPHA